MYLVIVDENGVMRGKYLLPFKSQRGEGWIWYYCNVYDTGTGTLVLDGYGNYDGEEWFFDHYEFDLASGKLKQLFQIERPTAFFHEKNSWFYRHFDSETGKFVMEYRTLGGETLLIFEEYDSYIRFIAYDPVTDRFFLVRSLSGNEIVIYALKPDTLEVKTHRMRAERDIEFIGFSQDGELLMIDSIY